MELFGRAWISLGNLRTATLLQTNLSTAKLAGEAWWRVLVMVSRAALSAKHPGVEVIGYTEAEFCTAVRISMATLRRMRLRGQGPREMLVGEKLKRITPQAAQEWVQAREAANADTEA